MMERTNKREQVFLEVARVRGAGERGNSSRATLRYSAWCGRCAAKVNLVAQNGIQPRNSGTGALHVRLVLGGKLLVCLASLVSEAKRQQ